MPPKTKKPIVYLEDMTHDQLMEKIEKLCDERRENENLVKELRKQAKTEFNKGVRIGFGNASRIALAMSGGKIDVIKAAKEKKEKTSVTDRTATVVRRRAPPPDVPPPNVSGAAGSAVTEDDGDSDSE